MALLSGRHALVTGGGRGIGRAVAAALTAAGAAVTVLGRQQAALDDAVAAGHAAGVIVADVTDPAAIEAGVKAAEAARGPFDILVANAGAAETAPFGKTGAEVPNSWARPLTDRKLMSCPPSCSRSEPAR